jgi:hypothetical protein
VVQKDIKRRRERKRERKGKEGDRQCGTEQQNVRKREEGTKEQNE